MTDKDGSESTAVKATDPFSEYHDRIKVGSRYFTIFSDDNYLRSLGGTFDSNFCEILSSLVTPDDIVLDVGANIGCTCLLFGQLAHTVIAFEPSPSTFRFLEKNISNSDLLNIEIYNFGLGIRDENLTLTFNQDSRAGGFISNKTKISGGHITEPVSIRSGDRFLHGRAVSLIKIDTEGFDLNVIRGLRKTIKKHKPIVVAELNHWCLNVFQRTSLPEYFEELCKLFPILFAFENSGARYDLHDPDQRYAAMHDHILKSRFPGVMGAFHPEQIERFVAQFPATVQSA